MKSIEQIRQANRQRVIRHVGLILYQRELTPEEVIKLNLMLDIGTAIPEVLSVLRMEDNKTADAPCCNYLTCASNPNSLQNNVNEKYQRTPLQMHFHSYVS